MNNKLKILLLVVILLLSSMPLLASQPAQAAPPSIIYQAPITIDNTQSTATPNPFQQMIQLSESTYKSYIHYSQSTADFEFSYANNTIIPAWIESNNSGTLTIWLKMYSIPASSSITIYIDFASLTTNLLSSSGTSGIGEAPQLSPTYAEYDNGANVFNYYTNFNGNSLPSGWVYSNQNYAVSNSLSITPASSVGPGYIGYDTSIPVPFIMDSYVTQWAQHSGASWAEIWWGAGYSFNNPFNSWYGSIVEPNSAQWAYWVSSGTNVNINTPSQGIFSEFYTSSTSGFLTNYTLTVSTSVSSVNSTLVIGGQVQNGATGTLIIQWLRIRAYPPNGVMPSVEVIA